MNNFQPKIKKKIKHTSEVIEITERRLKVLITGGCGFIGKNLAKYLHNRGDHVRIVDISRDLAENPETYCTEFILGDLRDLSTCHKAVKDVNWVFHFASNVGGIEYVHELNNFIAYKNDHLITVNIAQASIEAGIDKFFYASSACIYPEEKQLNSGESSNNDESGPNPQSLYAREKLNSEFVLMESINSTKLRIARFQNNIFGKGNNWIGEKENALAALIRKVICSIKEEGYYKIEILGSGDQCRNFLYIDDCIDAIIKLVESDYSKPLNIGSENAISIRELAYIAFETIGITREQVKLITDENKPDVQNRNSDNTLIKQVLNWSPKTSIRKGIERTTMWIKDEIETNINKCENESMRKEMKENYRKQSNVAKTLKEGIKFGNLLPITSRGLESPEDCLYNLHNFAQSVYETTQVDTMGINGIKFSLKFFIGIDKDDALFHPIKNNIAEQILKEHGLIDVETREFDLPPGSICTIWHDLAIDAYNQMCDYIVLLGDDIIIESTNWMSKIHEEFIKISNEKKVPCGFGIVAFTEITFPGFPTFPVMSRLQIDIFNGEPFPPVFSNQDADPFLFHVSQIWLFCNAEKNQTNESYRRQ